MDVLFDASWLVDGPPSGHNVVQPLIETWATAFPQDTIVMERKTWEQVPPDWVPSAIRRTSNSFIPSVGGWILSSFGSAAERADLVISQNFTPKRRLPSACYATLIHDAMFVEHPEWFTIPERIYLSFIRRSAQHSDFILSTSRTETERIKRVWPELAPRVRRIGLGLAASLPRAVPIRPGNLPESVTSFILAVGRINIRKNLDGLLRAYRLLPESVRNESPLVIVGQQDGRQTRLNPDPAVFFLGHTSESELSWLYKHATVYVFPSLDEGFGLPLIEADYFGTPVVCSNISVFREMDIAWGYFDPLDPQDMARVIQDSLDKALTGKRKISARSYDWYPVVSSIRSVVSHSTPGSDLRDRDSN